LHSFKAFSFFIVVGVTMISGLDFSESFFRKQLKSFELEMMIAVNEQTAS